MKKSKEEILFKTVKEDNILPITSICKLNCIFCSHKNNPSQIETYSFGHLELELIKRMVEFLDQSRPVIIGESASKIIEGEPFAHPDIIEILDYLRSRWPEIEIKITTSASFIKPNYLHKLEELYPLELNISLNAPAPEERVFLMNDPAAENVFQIIKDLPNYQIDFEASIVSMHHIKGYNYLEKTLDLLEDYPPQSLRIFWAGFSQFADQDLIPKKSYYQGLADFVEKKRADYSYPIIIEPQLIVNLSAEVEGVINDSAADEAGIKRGDIILKIQDYIPQSRVDAFYKIEELKNPLLKVERNNEIKKIQIKKTAAEKSGLIFSYDIEKRTLSKLKAYLKESRKDYKDISTALITSELAFKLFKYITEDFNKEQFNFELVKAENRFFSGTIISAGLLLNEDIKYALQKIDNEFDRIIMPEIIYDYYGNDLFGNHYTELADIFSAEVILL